MNVLSLCDGMSCGQIALKELGVTIGKYYAAEIYDKAIEVTQANFPDTVQLGDVVELSKSIPSLNLPAIDLVLFGFPCRSLSNATAGREKYNNGLRGVSGLFYSCNEILQWVKEKNNPEVKFIVENVESSKKDDLNIVSNILGVQPIMINSASFSAQERKRLYWTNIDMNDYEEPVSEIVLKDILDDKVPDKYFYDKDFTFHGEDKRVAATLYINGHDILKRVNSKHFKAPTLTSCRGGNTQKKVYIDGRCRKLTPSEYRKLQTVPDWYKMNVADSHIYNMCGDGWTIEVIKYILANEF